MKTKQISFWIAAIALVASMSACSKKETTNVVKPVIPPSHPINADTIGGFEKGTLLAGKTYTMNHDVYVKIGDTLLAQPGANIIVKNNSQFKIQGVLQSMGTQASPVTFDSDTHLGGTWGGFACDSAQAVTIQWTKIFNTGGPDKTGSARRTLVVSKPIKVDIEDSWVENGQDDGLGLFGGAQITILRNTIQSGGSNDGEGINVKTGANGVVAYNVVFSQAGTGIKLETAAVVTTAKTSVDVYNNTLVSCGWRRGAAEPGRGVSAGVSAQGRIYNNIIVNCYHGLEIFLDADVANVKYGNNLFYATADTYVDKTATPNITVKLRDGFYPAGAAGKAQTTDIISTSTATADPLFTSFDKSFLLPNGAANNNDFHLKSGSPAIGKGNPTYNADIGAYTSDGKGNKH
ncbi:right-handed parallel beta-helix repeat-containing protein [Mucilaginibacter ginsenosidivorax]|uniref:Right-handed parallel beta-helix repeat-containing protein n=1 Tax=Mucilaginibacter ginsenosidivorax TaxID=862126 RepID=A0A5B8W1E9_9SPHI|nr:right-handed parallel beta-helix repeat-containing protein [Mucilaginibacter ginsenosidivorax]QEC76712.1 right-handed parallel beta-helix repeat-containing protein [Mucilaginibacter ginsenosidivorax]